MGEGNFHHVFASAQCVRRQGQEEAVVEAIPFHIELSIVHAHRWDRAAHEVEMQLSLGIHKLEHSLHAPSELGQFAVKLEREVVVNGPLTRRTLRDAGRTGHGLILAEHCRGLAQRRIALGCDCIAIGRRAASNERESEEGSQAAAAMHDGSLQRFSKRMLPQTAPEPRGPLEERHSAFPPGPSNHPSPTGCCASRASGQYARAKRWEGGVPSLHVLGSGQGRVAVTRNWGRQNRKRPA